MNWQPIETAPKDGTVILAKRIYKGRLIAEGEAVFSPLSAGAPMRRSLDCGLAPPLLADHESADQPSWSTADRKYRFPKPTHWKPLTDPTK